MSQTFDDYRNSNFLFELNEMVKRLIKPMKSENRCYHLFDASNSDLIRQVEQSCSQNRVKYTWDFAKLTISVNETI